MATPAAIMPTRRSTGTFAPATDGEIYSRFVARLEDHGTEGCWTWTGVRDLHGYGWFRLRGQRVCAHRYAYEQAKGPIPDGLNVRHSCDNPPCCNPAHLNVGTQQENMDDMVERNRQTQGIRNPQAKLSDDEVREIRRRLATGESQRSVGASFGICQQNVSEISRRILWRHV